MGYGPRSDIAARRAIEDTFDVEALPLKLADPRFYHMDTALSALPNGEVMYVPGAFTPEGRALIADRVSAAQRIALGMDDACAFAANTVCIGNTLVMPGCGPKLRTELENRGYKVVTVPLGSFQRSGGAAFCLTLRLDRQSAAAAQPAPVEGQRSDALIFSSAPEPGQSSFSPSALSGASTVLSAWCRSCGSSAMNSTPVTICPLAACLCRKFIAA